MKFLLLMSLCLLGSARGAPRQLDDPPDASTHQAPAQLLSGLQAPAEQASADQAVIDQTGNEQAAGQQAETEQAGADQSTGTEIDCHTCSYMNDEGKCTRGEGSCTLQKSQQCMLKKIFEGGKLQFMVQGCENLCPSMSLFSHGTRMQLICCRDSSFCNKV